MTRVAFYSVLAVLVSANIAVGQQLEAQLLQTPIEELVQEAKDLGDAKRGGIAFFQVYLSCSKCHSLGDKENRLGPDLTRLGPKADDRYLVESLLDPSKEIKKGFEAVTVFTVDGKQFAGLVQSQKDGELVLNDVSRPGVELRFQENDIDEVVVSKASMMPKGQVNQLTGKQQFLDLVKYLMEIRDGGKERAAELQPPPSLYAARPLPEYEKNLDHLGLLTSLNQENYKRGEAIYNRLCINCHGTHDRPGSLPTSRRFAVDIMKNGADPFAMYQTLTRGFGLMVPQAWMVPQQKYDVIHYIREAYFKRDNPSQYFPVTQGYLAGLPEGDTKGPAPSNIVPWEQNNYGHQLIATYEVGNDASNFAYKGIAQRLDPGQGGISKGAGWMIFDHDTMRIAAGWQGKGFIDWNGINFNGRHNIHPRVVGDIHFENPTGPGWANPEDNSWNDPRLVGRDDRIYGPLPRAWAQYKGLYHHGNQTVVSYSIGKADVLETAAWEETENGPVFKRIVQMGSRDQDYYLQVAQHPDANAPLQVLQKEADGRSVAGLGHFAVSKEPAQDLSASFNGATFLQVPIGERLNMFSEDFTIAATIATKVDGAIFTKTHAKGPWVDGGKSLFIRGGKLAYDIGWVGALNGNVRVADGKPHDVALTFNSESGQLTFYVDGKVDAEKVMRAKRVENTHVLKIGFCSDNFPNNKTHFDGTLSRVQVFQRLVVPTEVKTAKGAVLDLRMRDGIASDQSEAKLEVQVIAGMPTSGSGDAPLIAGVDAELDGWEWIKGDDGQLRLKVPAGEKTQFIVWVRRVDDSDVASEASQFIPLPHVDLSELISGGPVRFPEKLTTLLNRGQEEGAFQVDVLTHPVENPWFAQVRMTGLDFYPDGDSLVVSCWDGDVWKVSGVLSEDGKLVWHRIASGLFQPLGVKIVDDLIYVGCRDQICILHDLNADGETDFYESFNSDHQVTDHFHEFAMGLQVDGQNNFYYAKSARHALPALVPHHGTLLRVSADGQRTDILATGFRAANGVCLNEDGSFIVTDQEGHWNPKNRINWVREGGFYGNMMGYHDVTDQSDDAMEQPLVWITNSFDRSPSELLWVDSEKWGPLNGRLLNLSYGYGKVYVVPHEEVDGQMQGGMIQFPIAQFPTGVMRGRFHPEDGQLYACGMFAWAGNQTQPGGMYRLRYTGEPVYLPIELKARKGGVELTFSEPVDEETAVEIANYKLKTWTLKRTRNYGSKHYDEKSVAVTSVQLSKDGKRVFMTIPDLKPTWCMEIKYNLKGASGRSFNGTIHNTIHTLK